MYIPENVGVLVYNIHTFLFRNKLTPHTELWRKSNRLMHKHERNATPECCLNPITPHTTDLPATQLAQ